MAAKSVMKLAGKGLQQILPESGEALLKRLSGEAPHLKKVIGIEKYNEIKTKIGPLKNFPSDVDIYKYNQKWRNELLKLQQFRGIE